MINRIAYSAIALALSGLAVSANAGGKGVAASAAPVIELSFLASHQGGGAEISAFDPATKRLFITNAGDQSLEVVNISNPSAPVAVKVIDLAAFGGPNSVAVHNGVVAVAVEAEPKTDPGHVVFFDTDGGYLAQVMVGSLPDMLTFTPNGRYLVVANEGEPNDDYTVDPEGTVSIIDMAGGVKNLSQGDVRTASFAAFNGAQLDASIRVFGPNASVAQDLEPEYIAVSADSRTAYVTLQENNALAKIDIAAAEVASLTGLGFKDHSLPGNELDASDRDGAINIRNWPVFGMYQPDTVAAFSYLGKTHLVTANEGDAREYEGTPGFVELERVRNVTLDPVAFPNGSTLRDNANLGRLRITTTLGDTDGDGDFDELHAFGARSFSIWSSEGEQVYDSGSVLERITAAALPADFNSTDDENGSFDSRSDDKGPEPEGLAIGEAYGRTYAFVGLERIGGVVVFDISNPMAPTYIQYINTRDFAGDAEQGTAGDLAPEGLLFIPRGESPTGNPLLVVTNEVSGTTTVFSVGRAR